MPLLTGRARRATIAPRSHDAPVDTTPTLRRIDRVDIAAIDAALAAGTHRGFSLDAPPTRVIVPRARVTRAAPVPACERPTVPIISTVPTALRRPTSSTLELTGPRAEALVKARLHTAFLEGCNTGAGFRKSQIHHPRIRDLLDEAFRAWYSAGDKERP